MTIQQTLASSGGVNWINAISTYAGITYGSRGIAKDSAGNIYRVSFEDVTAKKLVVHKFDAVGNIIWTSTALSTTDDFYFGGIEVDSSNNVYITGSKSSSGNRTILVAKWDSSGAFQWANLYGLTSIDLVGFGLCCDSSGNIYVCARYYGGSASRTTGYTFILKLNSSGTISWSTGLAGANTASGIATLNSIARDSSDNIYVVGQSEENPTYTFKYGVILKYNSSGTQQWKRKFDDGDLRDVTIDSSDNIYVSGYKTGSPDYFSVIAKYNTSGTIQTYITYKTTGATLENPSSLSCDANGNLYVGHGLGSVYSYTPSLTLIWANYWNYSVGTSVLAGTTGNVYVRGNNTIANFPNNGTKTGTYVVDAVSRAYSASSVSASTETINESAAGLISVSPSFTTTAYTTTSTVSATATVLYI